MNPSDLPPDLAAVERLLAQRPWPAPRAGFRQRLLVVLRRELNPHERNLASASAWRFAAIAATVLLWINFSMSVVNNMDWNLAGRIDRGRLEATADSLRERFPELSAREAFRQALLAQAGTRRVPRPDFQPSPDKMLRYKERVPWDMP